MKNRNYPQLVATFLLLFAALHLSAQPGTGMNYQGVARDANGAILGNQELTIEVGVINLDLNNALIWEETHRVTTSASGLFALKIGTDPEFRTAGAAESFSHIEWGAGEHALWVKMSVGDGELVDLGLSPILSVPYAAHAMQVQQPFTRMTVNSEGGESMPGEAIFEVRNSRGLPVFAVYDTMVWVYANDDPNAKSMKGGFAVGGYNKPAKGQVDEPYMYVTPDGVSVYISEDPLKGPKGGFAVGGYNKSKAIGNEYFRITPDSVRMFIRGSADNQRRAGFSIDGINPEGDKVTFLFMHPRNYFIGEGAGRNTTLGFYNTMLGYHAGEFNTEGSANVMIGFESGLANSTGNANVFIGTQAGMNNEQGTENVYLGSRAGMNNFGDKNVFLGSNAGSGNVGSGNIYLGSNAGSRNKGSNNVFLGNNAGDAFQEASNLFVLENGTKDETRSLMVGHFDHDLLRVNAFMGINAKPDSAYAIKTNGTISAQEVATGSDVRFKKNIESIEDALEVIQSLDGVTYEWNREQFPERNFDQQKHLGFIAQEVETVIPELVTTDTQGFKAVNYQKMSTLLVEAVKEQQQMILERDEKIRDMEERLRRLEALVTGD